MEAAARHKKAAARFAWCPAHMTDEEVLFPAPEAPGPPPYEWFVGNAWADYFAKLGALSVMFAHARFFQAIHFGVPAVCQIHGLGGPAECEARAVVRKSGADCSPRSASPCFAKAADFGFARA